MELRSEEEQEKKNKGKKIVLASLIILVVLTIITGVAILVLKQAENEKMKLSVNGKKASFTSDFILTDSNTGETYYSIIRVANLAGYEFYNGEYKKYSEDKTKCYVECENELAMFEMGSNIIYKNNSSSKTNFDSYKIGQTVKNYENMLYTTAEGIQIAFNTKISFNKANNTIILKTLPYLVSTYKTIAQTNGYTGISEDFINQKTLVKNMLVVNKDGKYGVISTDTFGSIIGNKYDKIVYIENTEEFIVTNEGKTGTISLDGETRIGLRYDDVGLIDGNNKIYYAKNNNLYGVLNQNGRVLVYVQYDQIGINRRQFPTADMKNDLFLYDNCIPLKKDDKWGLADKNGNIILNVEYDELGYIEIIIPEVKEANNTVSNNVITTPTTSERSINNIIVIPEIEGIVIGKNDKYGVVNKIGKIIIPCEYDKIYSITNEGKDEIYLEKAGRTIRLSRYLEENKISVESDNTNSDIVNYTNNNVTDNITNTTTNNDINNSVKNTTTNEVVTNNITNTTKNNTIDDNTLLIIL